jgi:hypothetical protein
LNCCANPYVYALQTERFKKAVYKAWLINIRSKRTATISR